MTLTHLLAILGLASFDIVWRSGSGRYVIRSFLYRCCRDTVGQDVAEYAIMLAVVLVFVIGMVRMIGTNASTVFFSGW